jgi:glyoxylase-like metal-dependent hydrolase (beta-lactamase superfamily II)
MDGTATPLHYPVAAAPPPGEILTVAPGVHWLRMPLPFALNHINLWLLDDGPGWTIVDTGYASPDTRAHWERIFASSLGGRPVTRIIVTHYHPDHIGLAGWLAGRWDAVFATTEKEWLNARMLSRDEGDDIAGIGRDFARRAGLDDAFATLFSERQKSYRRGVAGVPPAFFRLEDGAEVTIGGRLWRVVIGEGHAPEHACLHCAELGVLIAGDQVLPRISPNVSVSLHEPAGDPLDRFLASLARIRRLVPPDTLVLPSHNLPFYGLHTRIDELLAHHRARCGEILEACVRPMSAAELLPTLFRRPLDRHQTGFAVGEALAHLNYLKGQGTIVSARDPAGIERYRGTGR